VIDANAVREVFTTLGYPNVRWAARRGDRMEGSYARSADELVSFAEAYQDRNFYVQPNPSTRIGGTRVSADDIVAWRWFIVDLDPKEGVEFPQYAKAVSSVIDSMHRLTGALSSQRAWPRHTFSGRGHQLWYRVDFHVPLDCLHIIIRVDRTTLEITTEGQVDMRRAIRAAQSYWLHRLTQRLDPAYGVEIDPSCSDLPRLARCPGTVNQKTGQEAYVLRHALHALDGLSFLRAVPNERYLQARVPERMVLGPGTPWQAADPYLTKTASRFINQGSREPGRHSDATAAARSLAEAGIEYDQIMDALALGASRCSPPLEDQIHLERTARDAVARVKGGVDLTR
jgi:hypothetical protein